MYNFTQTQRICIGYASCTAHLILQEYKLYKDLILSFTNIVYAPFIQIKNIWISNSYLYSLEILIYIQFKQLGLNVISSSNQ